MRKERKSIPVSSIDTNNGQLPWLPKNPREWTQTDIDRTAKSIQEDTDFLEDRPLLLLQDGDRYIVFAGNLRREGAKKSGIKSVPSVIYYPETEDDQLTIKRRAMKDNGSFGSWDFDALANEWDDLPLADWGIPSWETDETPTIQTAEDDGFNEDKLDEIPDRCNPGDIWQLGKHRLMCGDSTKMEDFTKLMDGEKAQATITSPPYNAIIIDKDGDNATKRKYLNDDDKKTSEEYLRFLIENVTCLLDISDEVFYNIGLVSGNKIEIFQLINHFLEKFKDMIYWEKSNAAPMIKPGVINNLIEFIICFGSNNSRRFAHAQFSQGTYFNVIKGESASHNEYASIHKATFPVYLPAEIIRNFTDENAIVLDCFGGTGTTMIAAEQLKRRCYLMEIEPKYCDVIISRFEALTGEVAQLITPGEKVPENEN